MALRALHALGAPIILDINAPAQGNPTVKVTVPVDMAGSFESLLFSALPGCRFVENESHGVPLASCRGEVGRWTSVRSRGTPFPVPSDSTGGASLFPTLLRSIRQPPRATWIRWWARPVGSSTPGHVSPPGRAPRGDSSTVVPISPAHRWSRDSADREAEHAIGPFWEVTGLVATWGGPRSELQVWRSRLGRVVSSLGSSPAGGGLEISWAWNGMARRRWVREISPDSGAGRGVPLADVWLTSDELAAWLPSPSAEGLGLGSPTLNPGESPLTLGVGEDGAPVTLPWSSQEGHHIVVAGETGTGKSCALVHIVAHAISSSSSVVLLDPLGETARDLLASLPSQFKDRTLWISPVESPLGMNVLSTARDGAPLPQTVRERRVAETVSALRQVRSERYGETVYWGPRIEDVLHRTLSLAALTPGATLEDALDLLNDSESHPLPPDLPSGTREVARSLRNGLRTERTEDLDGARRVLQEVVQSGPLRRILACRVPEWQMASALEPGAGTLVCLDRSEIGGRPAAYLGSMILALVWSALVERADRTPVLLVLDEVQEYANEALLEMLRLGRRFNLHVLVTTQSLAGLTTELRDALLTNSRDIILFRGSPADARLAHESLGTADGRELLALPRGTAMAFLEKGSRRQRVRFPLPPTPRDRASMGEVRKAMERTGDLRLRCVPQTSEGRGQEDVPPPTVELPKGVAREPEMALLRQFAAGLSPPTEGDLVPIPVARLRELSDGGIETVRRLGARLQKAEALERTEGRGASRIWWVRWTSLCSFLSVGEESPSGP